MTKRWCVRVKRITGWESRSIYKTLIVKAKTREEAIEKSKEWYDFPEGRLVACWELENDDVVLVHG